MCLQCPAGSLLSEPEKSHKSDIILEELRRRTYKDRVVDVEEKTLKIVIFSLAAERFALYGADVKEIIPLVEIYYVPGTPQYIAGIINLRGDIESVITINHFIGLADSELTGQSRIIIAQKDGVRSGMLADSVEDVLDLPVSAIRPPLSTHSAGLKEFVAGEVLLAGRSILLLDLGRIFSKMAA